MPRAPRDPKTKEEFLSRLLSYDFQGDIRQVGEFPASLVRTGPNKLEITFPTSGVTFELVVRRPRAENLSDDHRAEHRSFRRVNPSPPPPPELRAQPEPIPPAPPEPEPTRPRRKYTRRQAPGAGR